MATIELEVVYGAAKVKLTVEEIVDRLEGEPTDVDITKAIEAAADDVISDGAWPGYSLRRAQVKALAEQVRAHLGRG